MRFDLTVNEFTRDLALRQELVVFGEQFWRPYVHVRDAARAIAPVLEAPTARGRGRGLQRRRHARELPEARPRRAPPASGSRRERSTSCTGTRILATTASASRSSPSASASRPSGRSAKGIDEVLRLLRSGLIDDPYDAVLPQLKRSQVPGAMATMTEASPSRVPTANRRASRSSPPTDPALPRHAFTVDVEDWYQSCLDYDAPITERVVRNVDRILGVLDECGVKGTFFVQGKVAETLPGPRRLPRRRRATRCSRTATATGRCYAMNRGELRDELERAKKTVEDAAGTAVTAFRAQDFSILAGNLWALETLADVGFEIDSSIFPMRSRHYGIRRLAARAALRRRRTAVGASSRCRWRSGRSAGSAFPVAGGGYFRLLPRRVIEPGLRSIGRERPAGDRLLPSVRVQRRTSSPSTGDVPRRLRASQGLGRGSFPRARADAAAEVRVRPLRRRSSRRGGSDERRLPHDRRPPLPSALLRTRPRQRASDSLRRLRRTAAVQEPDGRGSRLALLPDVRAPGDLVGLDCAASLGAKLRRTVDRAVCCAGTRRPVRADS